MQRTFGPIQNLYNKMESYWEGDRTRRRIAALLVLVFLLTLILIELNRQGLLPPFLSEHIPLTHFYAIYLVFNLLLIIEVISLVFALSHSVSVSVGKQFEIFSLILLRNSFKEFVHFDEPLKWSLISEPIYHILSDATGALIIFLTVGLFYHMQKHNPITADSDEQASFVTAKKLVSILLMAVFVIVGIIQTFDYFILREELRFFSTFYTILIFSDILVVLISFRYCSTYHIVFRNSGFALVTVVIRLALVAAPYYNVFLGVGAMAFALGLTYSYNRFHYE